VVADGFTPDGVEAAAVAADGVPAVGDGPLVEDTDGAAAVSSVGFGVASGKQALRSTDNNSKGSNNLRFIDPRQRLTARLRLLLGVQHFGLTTNKPSLVENHGKRIPGWIVAHPGGL
jgi:hypothetical protein